MSVINDVLEAVVEMAQATNPYATINIYPLPATNGISMDLATGAPTETFMTKNATYTLDVTLNGKHTNKETVSNALNDIHGALTRTKTLPHGTDWQITNIATANVPTLLEREQGTHWLYGSALTIKFYYRG